MCRLEAFELPLRRWACGQRQGGGEHAQELRGPLVAEARVPGRKVFACRPQLHVHDVLMQILPRLIDLLQRLVRQEVPEAEVVSPPWGQRAPHGHHLGVEHMVAGQALPEPLLRRVGLLLLAEGHHEGRLRGERAAHREQLRHTVEKRTEQHHLAEGGVDGQQRKLPSEWRQLFLGVQSSQRTQQEERVRHGQGRGWVDCLPEHLPDASAELEGFDLQAQLLNRRPLHLRRHGISHLLPVQRGIQLEELAWLTSAGAPTTLLGVRPRDLQRLQGRHVGLRGVGRALDEAAVDHKDHVLYCDRGLCDVCAYDDFPLVVRKLVEDPVLLVRGHHRVKRQHAPLLPAAYLLRRGFQLLDAIGNVLPTRDEDENGSRALVLRDVQHHLNDHRQVRLPDGPPQHVLKAVAGAPTVLTIQPLGERAGLCHPHVPFLRGRGPLLRRRRPGGCVLWQELLEDVLGPVLLDGIVRLAGDLEVLDRQAYSVGALQVRCLVVVYEALRIDGRRHQHQLQRTAPRPHD
mmetsp:Transcript_94798/g.267642  ORF Transcript_94798/g.267642 Transcript_94798/m.267642 type:complete len:516 (+) Transcript_94798:431-1978(+)